MLYRFSDFLLDTGDGVLWRENEEVPLRRQSCEVLVHLVANSGRLVTREELLETVWAGKVVTDASITQCLVDIRAALHDVDHQKIRTLPGRGYQFELSVECEEQSPGAPDRGSKRWATTRLSILLIALATLAFGWIAIGPTDRPDSNGAEKSIIVLPFRDLSRDGDQSYLANGIAEELLNLLAQIEELRVISRTTSWTFMDRDIDVGEIHRMLAVSHILEGSVRKSENRVRITVQLIDARTDSHIWSKTYDRTLGDVFAIQDEISDSVVDQLKLDLVFQPPTSRSIDPLAYELYLKGRHLTHTVRTPPAFEEAVAVLSKVVAMEPEYVPALWSLARALWNSQSSKSPSERMAIDVRIHELIDTMVELAPESNFTNGWLAFFTEIEGDIQVAAHYWERAVAGQPDASTIIQQAHAARFLGRLGRTEEALALAHYVVNRDPACSWCVSNLFNLYLRIGQPREAALELEKLLEWREPSTAILTQLSFAWFAAGEPETALELVESSGLEEMPGERVLRTLVFYELGEQNKFEAAFQDLSRESDFPSWDIAIIAAQTGQNDLAFESLDRAIEIDGPHLLQVPNPIDDYLFAPIKLDPRWRALRERIGIEDIDLSAIRFNPEFPAEVERLLASNAEKQ